MLGELNLSQIILALVEGYAVSENFKKAMVYGASVGISNLLPGDLIASDVSTQKYVVQPVAAGALVVLGSMLLKSDGNKVKNFSNGFIIGSSSAGLANSLAMYNQKEKIIAKIVNTPTPTPTPKPNGPMYGPSNMPLYGPSTSPTPSYTIVT
jgi:hypothetical protein